MLFAPVSEFMGRRWPLLVALLGLSIFTIGSAAAKDIQTLIICRFFAGLCGASPLCVVPAVLSDLYTNVHRGLAISVYALTVFGGPLLAPIVGGFVSLTIGWRWTLYITAIMGFLDFTLFLIWLEETYHPIILANKARVIRHQTGNWGVHAKHEKIELDFQEIWRKYFTRPVRMLITEPIVLAVTVYMSFIYGIVYAFLGAYPVVFQGVYGMNGGVGALPFLGLFLGVGLALLFIVLQQGSYARKLKKNNNVPIPEWRLPPVLVGAFAFTIGLFW
jgi:MFS transporter, DHA1 family, multidrug resistance protein